MTWTQLGVHRKPCGLLNAGGFYTPLALFIDQAVSDGFIKPVHRASIVVDDDPAARFLMRTALEHVGFEVILYIIEGKVRHEFGPGLKQVIENEAGDFIYIKPDVPHEVFNMSDTEPVVAFVARSSADEWDKIIPYDRNEPG